MSTGFVDYVVVHIHRLHPLPSSHTFFPGSGSRGNTMSWNTEQRRGAHHHPDGLRHVESICATRAITLCGLPSCVSSSGVRQQEFCIRRLHQSCRPVAYIAQRVPDLIEDASIELHGSFRLLIDRLVEQLKLLHLCTGRSRRSMCRSRLGIAPAMRADAWRRFRVSVR